MAYKIVITPHAMLDINEISDWYDSKQKGLAKKFVFAFKNRIKSLKKFPVASSNQYNGIFIVAMEKFPYGIHYRIEEDTKSIVVTGVYSYDRDLQNFRDFK